MPPRRTGTAYEKNNKWYVGIRLRDSRKWATPCPPREDGVAIDQIHARAVAANLQRDYDAGRWDPEAENLTSSTPAEQMLAPVIPSVIEHAREWIKTQTYSSVKDDARRIENYLTTSPLATMRLDEVRTKHVRAFLAHLKATPSARGGTLAPRSIINAYSVAQRAFERAVVLELIKESPCSLGRSELPEVIDKDPAQRAGWIFKREEVVMLLHVISIAIHVRQCAVE